MGADTYIYAKCTPGVYSIIEEEFWYSDENKCSHGLSSTYLLCRHSWVGKLCMYSGPDSSLSDTCGLIKIEWSPEINNQDATYSLNEECFLHEDDDFIFEF